MTTHRIEITAFDITVYGPRNPELDKLIERRGRYSKRIGGYEFPKSAEAEIRAIVAQIEADAAPKPATQPTGNPTGWSKASRRRAGRSHPLGEVTHVGDGFTEYEDTTFGGGRVQIWDNS